MLRILIAVLTNGEEANYALAVQFPEYDPALALPEFHSNEDVAEFIFDEQTKIMDSTQTQFLWKFNHETMPTHVDVTGHDRADVLKAV